MALKFANNASSVIAASILAADTVIQVSAGSGALFPAAATGAGDTFPLTLVDATGNREIVLATSRTGDLITVQRGQENTAPRAFGAGSRVDLRLTAKSLNDIIAALSAQATAIATKAPISDPAFTGVPSIAATPAIRDNSLKVASTAYADRAAAQYRGLGEIVFVSGNVLPPGCIWAQGQELSRATFAAYFADVGTTYGAGNGTTTFNAPDYQERTLMGRRATGSQLVSPAFAGGNSATLAAKLGATSGGFSLARTHLPNTTIPLTINPGGAHSHRYIRPVQQIAQTGSGGGFFALTMGETDTSTTPDHAHTGQTEALGSGTAISVFQPTTICNIAIFVGVF